MSFSQEVLETISPYRLLSHPFYQAWDAGDLSRDTLKTYSKQYYHHVKTFPRYISATHSNCDQLSSRQVLTENLHDEEHGEKHHPGLWLQFAEGLGAPESEAEAEELFPETKNLIDTFLELARSSYEEGLAALYIYEQQVPDICTTKMRGLREFYNLSDDRSLEYFSLHEGVDILHSEQTAELLDKLPEKKRQKAQAAAEKAAKALWGFLDGMQRESCTVH